VPSSAPWVKADGYGHGAGQAARAALAGGATRVAVASADEALGLREAGIAEPILVMGAISDCELPVGDPGLAPSSRPGASGSSNRWPRCGQTGRYECT